MRQFFKTCRNLSAAALLATSAMLPAAAPATAQASGDFQTKWDELVAAAKKEGTLTLSTSALPDFQHIFDEFSRRFGVRVQTDGGSGSSRATRILAERAAGRFTVDVGLMSVAANTRRMEPADALEELPPLLFHPEVTDTSKWYRNRHWYVDGKGTKKIFVYQARANSTWRFWYNTAKLKKEDIASLKSPMDFLAPKWKGKMADRAWGDPGRLGGMLEMYFAPDAGPEWIKKYLAEMDITFTSDPRLEESWFVRGSRPLKWDEGDIADSLQKYRGKFPIEVLDFPRKQGNLESRGSECCISMLKNAPHPNAAKLFVNWFLTKEVQTMAHNSKPSPRWTSLREDIPPGNTDPHHRRVPGQDYVYRDFDPDYKSKQKEAREFILKVFQEAKQQK